MWRAGEQPHDKGLPNHQAPRNVYQPPQVRKGQDAEQSRNGKYQAPRRRNQSRRATSDPTIATDQDIKALELITSVHPNRYLNPGEFYTIWGAQALGDRLKKFRRSLPDILLCHMVVIYKVYWAKGVLWAAVCTITSRELIPDLPNLYRIPIFPNTNLGWPGFDTHDMQLKLVNAELQGENKTVEKNSCLRWDNAFHLPAALLRPIAGKDKSKSVALDPESYELWNKLMTDYNIVAASKFNPRWKVEEEIARRLASDPW